MSVALQVEKTSKRGGRIIHEKDTAPVMLPPSFAMPAPPAPGICHYYFLLTVAHIQIGPHAPSSHFFPFGPFFPLILLST